MMLSARISGQREHDGEIIGSGQWPAIITPGQTARLRALFTDPSHATVRNPRRYLLTGLLRCGRCGAPMRGRVKGSRERYFCGTTPGLPGCGRTYIVATELEELIIEAVLYRLDTDDLQRRLAGQLPHDEDNADAQRVIDECTAQMEELAKAYGEREITYVEWIAARKPIQERLEAARQQLRTDTRFRVLQGFTGDGAELHQRWARLNLSRQRAIIAAVLDHAVIKELRVIE
jgi:site-specific DNA recombinase